MSSVSYEKQEDCSQYLKPKSITPVSTQLTRTSPQQVGAGKSPLCLLCFAPDSANWQTLCALQLLNCVVSFPKFHNNDTTDLLPTCCGLVATSWHVKIVCRVANKSATSWQLPCLRGNYGEMCLMGFVHYAAGSLYHGSFEYQIRNPSISHTSSRHGERYVLTCKWKTVWSDSRWDWNVKYRHW